MYVGPEARRHGAGRALAEAALAAARRLGYEVVRLDTTKEMVGAIRIYERLGFVPSRLPAQSAGRRPVLRGAPRSAAGRS